MGKRMGTGNNARRKEGDSTMTYLTVAVWFAVGYALATARYDKKLQRQQSMRNHPTRENNK